MKYLKNFKLFESKFTIDNLDSNMVDNLYDIFKKSYEESTGTSWNKQTFLSKSKNWIFFGDNNGFIALRPQKSGLYKLTGVAGNIRSIFKAFDEIKKNNIPVWGMVSQKIKEMLIKKGFKVPTIEEANMLYKMIPSYVWGNAPYEINDDGSLTFDYGSIGKATKWFVGNELYFNNIKKKLYKMKYLKLFENFKIMKCVSSLIVNSQGVLILKRGSTAPWMPNKWNLPGGILDENETEMQAAVREVFEETNLKIQNLKLFDEIVDHGENYSVLYFTTTNYSGDIDLAKNQIIQENSEFFWINLDTINNYEFVPHTKKIILKYLNNQ